MSVVGVEAERRGAQYGQYVVGSATELSGRDDVLTDYAAGNLSPAKHAILSCLVEINPIVAEHVSFREDIAAAHLDDHSAVDLSADFMAKTLATLFEAQDTPPANDTARRHHPKTAQLAPKTLRYLLGHGLRDISWSTLVPGVAVHDIMGDRRAYDGDRLYLLRAKGGIKMPEHGHSGEEWTLVLTGSYNIEGQIFTRGDLHIENGRETHAPIINEGEDCICLVMTQAPLVMSGWLPKMVQKFVGI